MFGKSPRHKAMQSTMLCSQEVISFMCGDHMMPILTHFIGITSSIMRSSVCVTGRYFTLFTCRVTCSLICVDYLDSEQLNCRCVLPVIGKFMFRVGQVKFGRLFNGILPNFRNIPSKRLLQEANVSLNLVS